MTNEWAIEDPSWREELTQLLQEDDKEEKQKSPLNESGHLATCSQYCACTHCQCGRLAMHGLKICNVCARTIMRS